MSLRISITTIFFLLFFSDCKKSHLVGEYDVLVGSWQWYDGYWDNQDSTFKLVFKEKGKYALYKGDKKVEAGRLLKTSIQGKNYLEFKSDNIIREQRYGLYLERRNVREFDPYYLTIERIGFTDQPLSMYKKVK